MSCLLVARPFTPGVAQAQYGQGGLFVLLWLLLLLVRQLTNLRRGPTPIHISALDIIFTLFFAWQITSGIAAWIQSSPRPAINSMWQWLSMGVSYLLVRQLVTSWHAIRAIMAVLIGLAAAMAAIGLEQQYRSAHEAQRLFLEAKDDVEALWDLTGEWLPPGSAQRQRYENRLFSPEPTATFALANSLAGFLAPWFVILIGLGITAIRSSNRVGDNSNPLPQSPAQEKKSQSSSSPPAVRHRRSRPQSSLKTAWMRQKQRFRFFQGFMVFVLVAASLLLTKSRSGYLAAVLGIGLLWPLCFSGLRLKRVFSFGILAIALLGVLLGLGIAAGWLDRAILTEAEKSLGYRLQYWQSTSSMIGAYPRLGCGLGQFQDTYTAYKLPDASEEIADPHNFLLEVAATAGIPAALLLITALGLLILQTFRKGDAMEETRVGTDTDGIEIGPLNVHGEATGTGNREGCTELFATEIKPVYCGGIAGLVTGPGMAWLDQLDVPIVHGVIACVLMMAVLWILHDWVCRGQLPWRLPLVGIVVLLIHLLAAGGISDPAVAGTFWVLAAIQINLPSKIPPRIRCLRTCVFPIITLIGLVTAYWTAYAPVIRCRGHMSRADHPGTRHELGHVTRELKLAAAADRFSAVAARRLANVHLALWQMRSNQQDLDAWITANDRALTLAPRAARQWQESASGWTIIWKKSGRSRDFNRAISDMRRAIKLYPNHAHFHAELACLWDFAGNRLAARASARKALLLDDTMRRAGHRDQFLDETMRHAMEVILDL